MKNIIKIASSALVATLAFGSVAFAAIDFQSNGNSASTSGGPGYQSNGNSASTVGNGPDFQSNGNSASTADNGSTDNGNSSNGSSSKRRSGGGSYRKTVSLTNVQVKVVGNTATVTWDTTPAAQGMLVYGPLSLATPTTATSFYGYAAGTAVTGATIKHSHTFTMASGITYYVRPVAIVGARAVYGSELKVGRTGTVVKTAAPAVGTIFDAPAKTVIDSKIPADVEVSKATTTSNVAAATESHSKIGSFFKKIWNTIIAPFCN